MPPEPASPVEHVTIDLGTKGFPRVAHAVPVLEVRGLGWSFDDLQPPVLALRRSALEHNLELMASYCEGAGVGLAPHGKTTMAPQLWRRQLDAGAWGLTAATVVQARVMRAAGVSRILLANELTDPGSIRWAAEDLREDANELLTYVDGPHGIDLLERHLREHGAPRPLPVLVELGHTGGRTGCREASDALDVARLAAGSSRLRLVGVAGFEGTLTHERSDEALARVRAYLDELRTLATLLLDEGLLAPRAVVTAGGSLYFDLVVERLAGGWPAGSDVRVMLRSGCYLTHDAGIYERGSPFAAEARGLRFHSALEAWGAVVSRPEPGLAILGLGRRDVPFDQGLPRPLVRRHGGFRESIEGRAAVTALNDQHAFCAIEDGVTLDEGDLVLCGVSHPCSAFDRWRVIPVLDDDDRVVEAVATMF